MNIFRLQLMAEMLQEMSVAIPVFEVEEQCDTVYNHEQTACVVDGFSLDTWTNAIGFAKDTFSSCGYTACAVGHAMFDVRFNAFGLYSENGVPAYQGKNSWEAVREFFGIQNLTAETLFSPSEYETEEVYNADGDFDDDVSLATPSDVLERVQYLLIHGEADLNAKYAK